MIEIFLAMPHTDLEQGQSLDIIMGVHGIPYPLFKHHMKQRVSKVAEDILLSTSFVDILLMLTPENRNKSEYINNPTVTTTLV